MKKFYLLLLVAAFAGCSSSKFEIGVGRREKQSLSTKMIRCASPKKNDKDDGGK